MNIVTAMENSFARSEAMIRDLVLNQLVLKTQFLQLKNELLATNGRDGVHVQPPTASTCFSTPPICKTEIADEPDNATVPSIQPDRATKEPPTASRFEPMDCSNNNKVGTAASDVIGNNRRVSTEADVKCDLCNQSFDDLWVYSEHVGDCRGDIETGAIAAAEQGRFYIRDATAVTRNLSSSIQTTIDGYDMGPLETAVHGSVRQTPIDTGNQAQNAPRAQKRKKKPKKNKKKSKKMKKAPTSEPSDVAPERRTSDSALSVDDILMQLNEIPDVDDALMPHDGDADSDDSMPPLIAASTRLIPLGSRANDEESARVFTDRKIETEIEERMELATFKQPESTKCLGCGQEFACLEIGSKRCLTCKNRGKYQTESEDMLSDISDTIFECSSNGASTPIGIAHSSIQESDENRDQTPSAEHQQTNKCCICMSDFNDLDLLMDHWAKVHKISLDRAAN